MRHIAILGSTGSIGTQALQVIEQHSDAFKVEVLTAQDNWQLLVKQAITFKPKAVVIGNERHYQLVKDALQRIDIEVFAGSRAISECVHFQSIDIVLSALVGFAGLAPTIEAIRNGKTIALANKETLVVAGELISKLAHDNQTPILPVDSEHSAIFQCLLGEQNPIEKVILTASGGPFRNFDRQALQNVTPQQALSHPNWQMGKKVTIDSASLMNKGFEVIEARWLFDLQAQQIEVVIHPQSVIHSMVQFADGAVKAQLGIPDMRLPIQYALAFPTRLCLDLPRLDFGQISSLTFETPDTTRFPNLNLAIEALKKGGNTPCILNAANEVAVSAFLKGEIGFTQMPLLIEKTLEAVAFVPNPGYADLQKTDSEARIYASEIIKNEKTVVWKY